MARAETSLRQRLRHVAWRDLTAMRPRDGLLECLHPLPWLAAAWIAAAQGAWPIAIGAWFMFFLTALRLNHEAIHGNLGFDRRGHDRVLHVLSALMLGSNNAVAFNHRRHHAHVGHIDDLEGKCATMPWWRVLAFGPLFPVEMHRAAWRHSAALRRQMRIDGALNAAVLIVALVLWQAGSPVGLAHFGVMLAAQCLTAFFAVWITHHGCDAEEIARTQRSDFVNRVSYNMFLHREHHLFPAVPVRRLGVLAARIDCAAPELVPIARHVVHLPFARRFL